MPKKLADGGRMFGDDGRATDVRGWQAAGPSLAAGGIAATRGPGAVAAVVALAPMVWAFGRLHRNAPSAGSTSDVVAVGIASGPGIAVALLFVDDVESVTTSWWWPVWAIAAAILATALTYFCRTRLVVSIAAILAAAGMLVYFYVALSAIARAATGTVPHLIGGLSPQSGLRTSTLLIAFGLTLLGVEAVTTLNSRVSSVSRPIGSAMAAIALCAAMGWLPLSSRPTLSWPSTSTKWCCWPRIYLPMPTASGRW